ncbi:hypothetical protein, partial [Pantoea ananatis]|uniref:hypothetical protein n=1 Tax=Pantoea ananas TaxID=553 RepID=UPI001B3162FB
FSDFAGRRSIQILIRILWWLMIGMSENLWPDMRGTGKDLSGWDVSVKTSRVQRAGFTVL